ncbi:hypothetical protein A2U01_0078345, partial [Trifolium medium]|nr:hypothetical protein [Trifolium medium]
VDETLKGTVPETDVVPDVGTSVAPKTITSETIRDNAVEVNATEKEKTHVVVKSGSNLVDYSESNESSKSLSGSKEVSDPEVVIMGDTMTGDK